MLLAVNIGNSKITVGIFDNCGKIVSKFKLATDTNRTSDEYASTVRAIMDGQCAKTSLIDSSVISSVVPQLTCTISEALFYLTNIHPLIIGPGVKTGFSIKIDTPAELGSDMVANTAAVIEKQKEAGSIAKPSVIVDMNTVTTVSAINSAYEYIGCSIAPGIQMSFDTMHSNTALLPNVSSASPRRVIGKNSQEAVRSGVICGNAIMLDGFVYRFAKEMRCKLEDLNLIITGEYARYVLDTCYSKFVYNEDLTLKGLYYIYRNNIK